MVRGVWWDRPGPWRTGADDLCGSMRSRWLFSFAMRVHVMREFAVVPGLVASPIRCRLCAFGCVCGSVCGLVRPWVVFRCSFWYHSRSPAVALEAHKARSGATRDKCASARLGVQTRDFDMLVGVFLLRTTCACALFFITRPRHDLNNVLGHALGREWMRIISCEARMPAFFGVSLIFCSLVVTAVFFCPGVVLSQIAHLKTVTRRTD